MLKRWMPLRRQAGFAQNPNGVADFLARLKVGDKVLLVLNTNALLLVYGFDQLPGLEFDKPSRQKISAICELGKWGQYDQSFVAEVREQNPARIAREIGPWVSHIEVVE